MSQKHHPNGVDHVSQALQRGKDHVSFFSSPSLYILGKNENGRIL